jgi:hypothetical protein
MSNVTVAAANELRLEEQFIVFIHVQRTHEAGSGINRTHNWEEKFRVNLTRVPLAKGDLAEVTIRTVSPAIRSITCRWRQEITAERPVSIRMTDSIMRTYTISRTRPPGYIQVTDHGPNLVDYVTVWVLWVTCTRCRCPCTAPGLTTSGSI